MSEFRFHRNIINDTLRDHKLPPGSVEKLEHNRAMSAQPAILRMLIGAGAYADDYRKRFESKLGDDGVLGPAWEDIMRGIKVLLDGELHGLSAGLMNTCVCRMLTEEGINPDIHGGHL